MKNTIILTSLSQSYFQTAHEVNILGMYIGGIITLTHGSLIMGEMAVLQLLYVTNFTKMLAMDDSFIFMIVIQVNLVLLIGPFIIRIYIDEPFQNIHYQTMNFLNQPIITSEFSNEYEPYFKLLNIW